jgi:hypothetical protein
MRHFSHSRKVVLGRGRFVALALIVALSGLAGSAHAVTISMQPLTSFGGLNTGWLPPANFPSGGTGDAIRDLAFNPISGDLLVANASTAIPINAVTGTFGTALPTGTGIITGGARSFNTVAVTDDGVIYGGNLTSQSTTSPYKVYRWASQSASAPTLHYSGDAGLGGSRVGDDLTANGSDSSGLLAAGFGATPNVSGNNSFTTVTTGSVGSAGAVTYTGGAAGDFRLGITFANANTVLGAQGGSGSARVRAVSFVGTTGSLIASGTPNAPTTERGLLYFTAYGTPLLATQEWGTGVTTNTVRLYDATNLLTSGSLGFIQSINLTTSTNVNGNGIGGLAVGTVNGTPTLYALSTNNGIQALQIVPEPSTTLAAGICTVGLAAMMLRGRRRGQDA